MFSLGIYMFGIVKAYLGIGIEKTEPKAINYRYLNLSLGTVSFGLGWSRMISGHFWKSLGLANSFLGLGETCLGIGIAL